MSKITPRPTMFLSLDHFPKAENHLTIQAKITPDEIAIINSSRLKYDLLMNGDENCYVSAKALHEALGKPHGEFKDWTRRVIKPFIVDEESSYLEVFTESGRQKLVTFEDLQVADLPHEKKKRENVGKQRDVFLRIEDAQDLAMLTRTPEGAEVRKYFRTVNRVFEKCISHKGMRETLESMSKAVAQAAGKAALLTGGKFDVIAAGKAKYRFNRLVKEIAGSRNPLTDGDNTHFSVEQIFMILKAKKTLNPEDLMNWLNIKRRIRGYRDCDMSMARKIIKKIVNIMQAWELRGLLKCNAEPADLSYDPYTEID